MATDLSVGTSFELDDVDKGVGADGAGVDDGDRTGGRPSRRPESAPRPLGGSTAQCRAARPRRRSGFWLGVMFALAAVVGLVYAKNWAEQKGVVRRLVRARPGRQRQAAANRRRRAARRPSQRRRRRGRRAHRADAAPPAPAPARRRARGDGARPRPRRRRRRSWRRPRPTRAPRDRRQPADADRGKAGESAGDRGRQGRRRRSRRGGVAARRGAQRRRRRDRRGGGGSAACRQGGREEAGAPPQGEGPGARGRSPRPPSKPAPAAPAKVETAVLHITSAPAGAVVRTKARVLGRTPINLHFKTGNTYEIKLVKKGYTAGDAEGGGQQHEGSQDRRDAVEEEARAKKRSFFHPHR